MQGDVTITHLLQEVSYCDTITTLKEVRLILLDNINTVFECPGNDELILL